MDYSNMTAPTKVLFLEIDAGDKFVLQNGAAEGWLPNIRSLLDRGLVGDTLAPEEFFVNGIWPSLYTGVDPAKHGMHGLVQLKTGTYDFYRCYIGEHIKRKPFWSFLSEAGKRVAILDIPLSGITEDIDGIQSVEWGAHDGSGFRAWPKAFEEDVLSRFGQYPRQSWRCKGTTSAGSSEGCWLFRRCPDMVLATVAGRPAARFGWPPSWVKKRDR